MPAHDPSKRTVNLEVLAGRLQRSKRTARRVWAERRAEYEAASLARTRPWEAEGISKSTWYRRRQRRRQAEPVIDDGDDIDRSSLHPAVV